MPKDSSFVKETEALRDLRTLEAIERNPHVSQRELARSMGVAVGIANACIHTLVRKGMVKIRGDNNRSITYHLTKKGLLHKSALAMQWTLNTLSFYREARHRVSEVLASAAASGVRRLALWGATELSEIVLIAAGEAGLEVVAVVEEGDAYMKAKLGDMPVGGLEVLEGTSPEAVAVCGEMSDEQRDALGEAVSRLEGDVRILSFWGEEPR